MSKKLLIEKVCVCAVCVCVSYALRPWFKKGSNRGGNPGEFETFVDFATHTHQELQLCVFSVLLDVENQAELNPCLHINTKLYEYSIKYISGYKFVMSRFARGLSACVCVVETGEDGVQRQEHAGQAASGSLHHRETRSLLHGAVDRRLRLPEPHQVRLSPTTLLSY